MQKWNGSSLDPEGVQTAESPKADALTDVDRSREEEVPGRSPDPAARLPGRDEVLTPTPPPEPERGNRRANR